MKWTYDPTKSKYTKALLEPIVKESVSYYDVFRKLGLKPTGSANGRIRHIVGFLQLDTSHFLGRGSNCGVNKKGGPQPVPFQEVLIYDRHNGRKEKALRLRRALIQSGILEECEECGLGPEWKGKPLRLQIDHRNGDFLDNRPGNPRFLCPNCHAQTETFGSKNMTLVQGAKPWAKGRSPRKRIWKNGKRVYGS